MVAFGTEGLMGVANKLPKVASEEWPLMPQVNVRRKDLQELKKGTG